MVPKIFTITLNPAVDHNIQVGKFRTGDAVRALNSNIVAAGKGINVARTISCLKKQALAFCMAGEDEVRMYSRLRSRYFRLFLYPIKGNTRSNITVADANRKLIIHIQTRGFALTEEQLQPLIRDLENQVSAGDIVVISGSTPEGISGRFLCNTIAWLKNQGCTVIFDSSGSAFRTGLEGKPDVIKPNVEELGELSGKEIVSVPEIVRESKMLNESGISMVFVSRGKKGVILTCKDQPGYWTASVSPGSGPREGNEVGCGDAMIGGIAASLAFRYDTGDILRMAAACGAANLLSQGPGVVDPAHVGELFGKVTVRYHR